MQFNLFCLIGINSNQGLVYKKEEMGYIFYKNRISEGGFVSIILKY